MREVERMNNYERKWKTKTNLNKFRIIHLDRKQHHELILNNRILPTYRDGVIFELKISRTGYAAHIAEKKRSCKVETGKLWRLKDLGEKKKRIVYQAIISSKLEYPPIPLHCVSETYLKALQRTRTLVNTVASRRTLLSVPSVSLTYFFFPYLKGKVDTLKSFS